MAHEHRGVDTHEGGETYGHSAESDIQGYGGDSQEQTKESEAAKAECGKVADPVTNIGEKSGVPDGDLIAGDAAESIESRIESLTTTIVAKDEKIADLELTISDRDRRIKLLQTEVTKLREMDEKQKTTIRTQSETIRKNPAPFKNQQRWIESIREQFTRALHQPGYRPAGAIRQFAQMSIQPASGNSVVDLGNNASTVLLTPTTDNSLSSSATVSRMPTGLRSHPFHGFDVRNPALRGLQMPPAASEARLPVLPEGEFHDPLTPLTNQGVDVTGNAIEGILPNSTVGRQRLISPPPGLPPPSTNPTLLLHHTSGQSEIDRLNQLRTAFDALFSKTAMWAASFAGGRSSIPLSPRLIDLIRKCDITDQQSIELLSQPTKASLTARILNTIIKDRILVPRFLQSIDRDFSDQVGRTYARVQGQVQASLDLRRNVMINIGGLFESLPQRGDWGDWVTGQIHQQVIEVFHIIEPLLDDEVRIAVVDNQCPIGRLTEIIGDAIKVSILMYSQPCMYKFLNAQIGAAFDPAYMRRISQGGVQYDEQTCKRVLLAVAPMVCVNLWCEDQLVTRMLRACDVV